MSDIMRPMPLCPSDELDSERYRPGLRVRRVQAGAPRRRKALPIFEEKIRSPYGPAAGPHTQLAQNIIAAYAAGSRFFEVKTVQVMDGEELSSASANPASPPRTSATTASGPPSCTSPGLRRVRQGVVRLQAAGEGAGTGRSDGFVFNMSVGYDLRASRVPRLDAYIEG